MPSVDTGLPARAIALFVQTILHGFRGLEGQLLRSGDLDRGAGRRVAAFACRTGLDLELAETRQVDFFAAGGRVSNGLEHTVDNGLGGNLGQAIVGGNFFNEVSGIHNRLL